MDIKIIFRVLLFIPVVLFVIYKLLPSVEYLWLSCDELSLLEADGYNAIVPNSVWIFVIYVAIWLLISTALYFFIAWARIVYASFVFISMILMALVGNRVSAPVENIVMFLTTLSVGAVLALMYSAAMQQYFAKDEDNKEDEDEEEDEEEDGLL